MELARFGTTDIEVSRIALGTWAIGGWLWGGTDVKDAVRAIHEAMDLGITTIDTAPVYGFGLSEELVAKAIAEKRVPRDQVVIATKAGLEWDDEDNVRRNSRPERIRQEVEQSLRRLRTDYIDIYQIHQPDPDTPVEDTAAAMKALLDEGKVRAIGVSNYDVEQMERWRSVAPLHSNQLRYNLLERGIDDAELPYCRHHGLALLAYSPLARGLLTGKYTAASAFPEGDSRARDKRFQGEAAERNWRIVPRLKEYADALGKSIAQLAVRWVLDQPDVAVPSAGSVASIALWGARRPGQIAEAAGAVGWTLSAEQLADIHRIIDETV